MKSENRNPKASSIGASPTRTTALLLAVCLAGWSGAAQVPGIISHQGKLTVQGTNFTGIGQFKFALVNAAGDTTWWSYDGTSTGGSEPTNSPVTLSVTRGVFSVNLGDTTVANMTQPVPPSVFTHDSVWLRVWVDDGVNGSQRLIPDRRITAAGYALVAGSALAPAATATNFSGPLAGEVTGTQIATVVSTVGGVSAASVAAGANAANAATNANTPDTLVKRNASGDFAAGTITATYVGNGAGLSNLTAATLVGTAPSATNFTAPLAGDVTGPQGATVVSTVGGVTATQVASGANGANAATSTNLPDTLVKRSASGDFAAGTITATYVGNGAGLSNLTAATLVGTAPSATNFTAPLVGDVTGPQGATVVSTVGGVTATQVASGANGANAATSTNLPDTLVKRSASGDFAAGTITASYVGNGAGVTNLTAAALVGTAPSATNFTAPLAGDVTGPQGATVVSTVGGVTAAQVASGANGANAATSTNLSDTMVKRSASGDFAAGTITATYVGNGAGLTNLTAAALVGTAPSATNFTAPLVGEVTGPQGATVVSTVGGVSAANVATGANAANAATAGNTPGAIVRRDPLHGDIAAGTFSGKFVGDGSGLTNLPTAPSSFAVPPGTILVSLLAQDAALLTNGYRSVMTVPAPAWINGSSTDAASARAGHSAIWDGQEMIVWGGTVGVGSYVASGAMYRPDSDSWAAMNTDGAPSARSGHTAVWTGSEMIVWGGSGSSGHLRTGGKFAPGTQTWRPVTTTGAPFERKGHQAVWTGSRMLVWGGLNNSGLLDDGALYDPVANQWTALAVLNPPEARHDPAAVWAGDRFIVWGGTGASGELNSGGQLIFSGGNPTDWAALPLTGAPSARSGHSAVWTGDQMLIWGGQRSGTVLGDGAAYSAQSNTWTAISPTNAPSPRTDHAAVWTGLEMLIVDGANASGELSSSAAYDPVFGQWRSLSNLGGPLARSQPGAVWTGTEIMVFGGLSSGHRGSLQRLVPQPNWYFYRKL